MQNPVSSNYYIAFKLNNAIQLLCLIFLAVFSNTIISAQNTIKDKYLKNEIIFKVKPEYKSICKGDNVNYESINSIFSKINVESIKRIFPHAESPKTKFNDRGQKLVDLSQIYVLKYNSDVDIFKIIKELNNNNAIEYAQPRYLPEPLYSTNDPSVLSQYFLYNIKAFEAWDICQGDSTIVIGITDTGTQNDHEDLVDNVYYNYNDPIDGIDNDGDGYVDNFRGWDLGDNDNNPQWDATYIQHGVTVAGSACARTDNGIGVSGTGFKTKFLPIKISDANKMLTMAYEGIVYAADHGCSIINCSWGGIVPHPYGQDIVNYATFNRNALVIAAAGNNGHTYNDVMYPCTNENVFCVAASDENDIKWNKSCFGPQVDITAPGVNIYTTFQSGYASSSGTSFATPIVAGCAALVKSYFPAYNALQIAEVLRVTADNIDTIPANSSFANNLGSGRVNLLRALSDALPPSVRFSNVSFLNKNTTHGNVYCSGDTLFVKGLYTNYLTATNNLSVKLASTSSYVAVLSNTNNVGVLGTLNTINNNNNPFKIKVAPNAPSNTKVFLKLTYTDNNYTAIQYISLILNKTYIDIDTNNIYTTITSNGRIGFNYFVESTNYGVGFSYKHCENIMSEGGLLIGNSISKVSDCLYAVYDFKTLIPVDTTNTAHKADLFVYSKFNDDYAANKLKVDINQNVYAWKDSANADYIIIEYLIKNNNPTTLSNLYAGIYMDWDLLEPLSNKINFNAANRFSYTYSSLPNSIYAGIKLLSNTPFNHYAFDAIPGGGGTLNVNIYDGFSKQEMFQALSTTKNTAGMLTTYGNNVVDLLSTGPLSIDTNDTVRIAFALMAANSLHSLENTAIQAQYKYDSLYSVNTININEVDNSMFWVYPNPTNDCFSISMNLPNNSFINIELTDITGKVVETIKYGEFIKGKYNFTVNTKLKSGMYFIRCISNNKVVVKKICII